MNLYFNTRDQNELDLVNMGRVLKTIFLKTKHVPDSEMPPSLVANPQNPKPYYLEQVKPLLDNLRDERGKIVLIVLAHFDFLVFS